MVRLVILWRHIAILRCSISRQFCTQFAFDNDTTSVNNLYVYLNWWIGSSTFPTAEEFGPSAQVSIIF